MPLTEKKPLKQLIKDEKCKNSSDFHVESSSSISTSAATFVNIPENELEKKMRMIKLQRESDLDHTAELFGISKEQLTRTEEDSFPSSDTFQTGSNSISSFPPTLENSIHSIVNPNLESIADFEQYADILIKQHILPYESHKYFPNLLENLIINLIKPRDLAQVRKINGILQDIIIQKQKEKTASEKISIKNKKESAPSLAGGNKKHGKIIDLHNYDNNNEYDDFY